MVLYSHRTASVNRFIELDCLGHVWKDKVYQTLVAEFKIDRISWQELLNDYESQFLSIAWNYRISPITCFVSLDNSSFMSQFSQ
jgi:hypothetical protein